MQLTHLTFGHFSPVCPVSLHRQQDFSHTQPMCPTSLQLKHFKSTNHIWNMMGDCHHCRYSSQHDPDRYPHHQNRDQNHHESWESYCQSFYQTFYHFEYVVIKAGWQGNTHFTLHLSITSAFSLPLTLTRLFVTSHFIKISLYKNIHHKILNIRSQTK